MPSPPRREARERELREAAQHVAGDANEVLNSRAVAVMQRMSDKLMGRDGLVEGGLLHMAAGGAGVAGAGGAAGGAGAGSGAGASVVPVDGDSVPAQVQRLIEQATSHENLCQSYIGWCPFW